MQAAETAENRKRFTVGYTESSSFRCLEDLEEIGEMKTVDPLRLCYCGWEKCSPSYRFGPYVRENFVIHIVLSGRGTLRVGKKTHTVRADQAFLITPGTTCTYQADPETPWEYIWIGFQGFEAASAVEAMGFSTKKPVISLRSAKKILEEIDELMKLRSLSHADVWGRKSRFFSVLSLLTDAPEPRKDSQRRDAGAEYVRKAVEIILGSYQKKLRIADIASEIGINRSYLTNIFKNEMHISPHDFLIRVRLEKAARLLRETDHAVGVIAAMTGYDDSLAFSRAFKQKYGLSPSNYRSRTPLVVYESTKGAYVGNYHL